MTAAGWVFMSAVALLLLVIALALAAIAYRLTQRRRRDGDTAQQLLDQRFARGEVDADEYRRRREILRTAGKR